MSGPALYELLFTTKNETYAVFQRGRDLVVAYSTEYPRILKEMTVSFHRCGNADMEREESKDMVTFTAPIPKFAETACLSSGTMLINDRPVPFSLRVNREASIRDVRIRETEEELEKQKELLEERTRGRAHGLVGEGRIMLSSQYLKKIKRTQQRIADLELNLRGFRRDQNEVVDFS